MPDIITGYFPTGPYVAGYGDVEGVITPVGLMEGPIRHQQNLAALPVRCSEYGQTIIDYVVQGGGVFIVLTLKEWFPGARKVMWPFYSHSEAYDQMGVFPITGSLLSSFAKTFYLAALPGTPAGTVTADTTKGGPCTRTYWKAILMPAHNLDITFGPVERNVPIVLTVLPCVYDADDFGGGGSTSPTRGQPVFYEDTYLSTTMVASGDTAWNVGADFEAGKVNLNGPY